MGAEPVNENPAAAPPSSSHGNPASPTPSSSHGSYVPQPMSNRESQSLNLCLPSAPANPSCGSSRRIFVWRDRPLSGTGSRAAKSETSEKSLGWYKKLVGRERPSKGASGGRGSGNAISTTCSGGSRDRKVNPLSSDLKADDPFDQENTVINFDAYEDIHVQTFGVNIPPHVNTFAEMDLGEALNLNIKRCKFAKPTPMQKYVIPISLAGRHLLVCAQTGSGKKAAFCIPIIAGILRRNEQAPKAETLTYPLALILSAKTELRQIHKEATRLARDTRIEVVNAHGRWPIPKQILGDVILVATPGRLADLFKKGKVSLSEVKYLVLDEADRMLDMGLNPQIRKIVEQMDMPSAEKRQTLLFSATFPKEIQKLASDVLYNYIFLAAGRVGSSTGFPVHSLGTLLTHSSSKKCYRPEHHVPVGFFDGACKETNCGCGATLLLSRECRVKLYWNGGIGEGKGTSMMAEILALWGLIWFANHFDLKRIHIFGDSQNVIEHMNNDSEIKNQDLRPWLDIINNLKNRFKSISFFHVSRHENEDADILSKKGLRCRRGKMHYRFIMGDDNNTSGNNTYDTVDLPALYGHLESCLT